MVPITVSIYGLFISPHVAVSFGRDTGRRLLLYLVSVPEEAQTSHAGSKVNVLASLIM